MSDDNQLTPLHPFRFWVDFKTGPQNTDGTVDICSGAFSECTGLEGTMEPKAIKEGGNNYGVVQRAGPVSFATVILKRGMTATRDLWHWFDWVNGGKYAYRLYVTITMFNQQGKSVLAWRLDNAIPVKFKSGDLNAKGTEVVVEELHLAHEGLTLVTADRKSIV
jgi:phage tail-like protein